MSLRSLIANIFKPVTSVNSVSKVELVHNLPYSFTPLHDFYSDEFRSNYVSGLAYTVRLGNVKLDVAVRNWIREQKVKIVPVGKPLHAQAAIIRGKGVVR